MHRRVYLMCFIIVFSRTEENELLNGSNRAAFKVCTSTSFAVSYTIIKVQVLLLLKQPNVSQIRTYSKKKVEEVSFSKNLKPQSHIHDFGPGRATLHPELASR